ncbi:MAG: Hsp70 family protein [Lachnospiraceae bacterium]|nr:Hsp70 family protein [Lachnospiraceae bacterium]
MILGIDLGTSNSMAAVYKEGQAVIIESRTGRKQIPSIVSIDEEGNFFAGDVAKERMVTYPERTAGAFKRGMGTEQVYTIGGKQLKAVELSAIVLRNIKEDAERFLGEEIRDAVISVPAFFSNPQRKAVIQAGELAGFHVRQIINEPTAAAMAYGIQDKGLDDESPKSKVIMVMDLGGGTFDISIVEQTGDIMEVVAVCGDNHLGGEDFTKRLMNLFLEANEIEGALEEREEAALWKQAEQVKKEFGREEMGSIRCNIRGKDRHYEISEPDYEKACFDLLERMRKLALKAIDESKYEMEDVSEILMVGGGMKLSVIQKMINRLSGSRQEYKIDPDEAVVAGAALTGHLLEQKYSVKDLIMTDICPYDLGCIIYEWTGYDFKNVFHTLMKKNTTIPAKRTYDKEARGDKKLRFTLYQANDKYVDEFVKLGKISAYLPETEKGKCHVKITVICDVNGIVKVELYIRENRLKKEMLICNENCELTIEEAKKRMEELQYLKSTPLEEEVNKLVYARAERMYEECVGEERKRVGAYLEVFEQAISSFDEKKILYAREQLTGLLDSLEKVVF